MRHAAALAILLAPAPAASAPPACVQALRELCSRLAARPVLLRSPDGIVANPARASELFVELRAAGLSAADPRMLESRLGPLFDRLKARAKARYPGDGPGPRSVRAYIDALPLEAQRWERCERQEDPFGAAATQPPEAAVLLCPWMSRLTPSAAAWVLGHELGHHLDRCWHEDSPRALLEGLGPAGLCEPEQIEPYADRLGAALVAELAASGELALPGDADERASSVLQHYLNPSCDPTLYTWRLDALLQQPALAAAVGCGP